MQCCIYFAKTNNMQTCCWETRKFDSNLPQVYTLAITKLPQVFTSVMSNLLHVRYKFKLLSGTLLGIDFLESVGITLNLPQRSWHFIDNPENKFPFLQLRYQNIPILKAKKKLEFDDFQEETLPGFLKWANELKMLSDVGDTPSPAEHECSPSPKKPRWQLTKLDTPPRPSRSREPADVNVVIPEYVKTLRIVCDGCSG